MARTMEAPRTRLCDGGQPGCKSILRPGETICVVCAPAAAWSRDQVEGAIRALADSATERPRASALMPRAPAGFRLGCRVFSATLNREREALGDLATGFLRGLERSGGRCTDYQVMQSSDQAYHCLSLIFWYVVPSGAAL